MLVLLVRKSRQLVLPLIGKGTGRVKSQQSQYAVYRRPLITVVKLTETKLWTAGMHLLRTEPLPSGNRITILDDCHDLLILE